MVQILYISRFKWKEILLVFDAGVQDNLFQVFSIFVSIKIRYINPLGIQSIGKVWKWKYRFIGTTSYQSISFLTLIWSNFSLLSFLSLKIINFVCRINLKRKRWTFAVISRPPRHDNLKSVDSYGLHPSLDSQWTMNIFPDYSYSGNRLPTKSQFSVEVWWCHAWGPSVRHRMK